MRAFLLLSLLTLGAKCGAPVDPTCVDLEKRCPSLQCVEHAVDSNQCPICECAVQACLLPSDCEERSPPQECRITSEICEPAPACTDNDDDTPCPAACFGRCEEGEEEEEVGGSGSFCFDDSSCGAGFCRFDDRFCLVNENGDCSGWCADGCAEVETIASDPLTGQCFDFKDACVPPGFIVGC